MFECRWGAGERKELVLKLQEVDCKKRPITDQKVNKS